MTRTSSDRVLDRARQLLSDLHRLTAAVQDGRIGRTALACGLTVAVIVSTVQPPVGGLAAAAAPGATPASGGTVQVAPLKDRAPLRLAASVPDGATGPAGAALAQVEAVLERARRMVDKQGHDAVPHVVQAAGELGMLYSTFRAQQAAASVADAGLRARTAPERPLPADGDDSRAGRPLADGDRHDHGHGVELDDLVRAAKRLAGVLDQATSGAGGAAPDQRSSRLRASVIDAVHRYAEQAARYANGHIPADVLCELDFSAGHLLRCDAAEALERLNRKFEKRFGNPIPITDSYRSYAAQVRLKKVKPYLAAVPGTSNHGWGLAVDLAEPINTGHSAEYRWLREHGPEYGWDNPSWARPGGVKPEPWHFEFFAAAIVLGGFVDGTTTADDTAARGRDRRDDDKPKQAPLDEPARRNEADDRPVGEAPRNGDDEEGRTPTPARPTDAPSGGSRADDADSPSGSDDSAGGTDAEAGPPSPEPEPTDPPTTTPEDEATSDPTDSPTDSPTEEPTDQPSTGPSDSPSEPSDEVPAGDTTTSPTDADDVPGE
ncbi:D-alanyl-D-alanine carboxypeptidase family protein [Promicromonospora panici]|uniref:D-alanyl-D-alanine carboxypeptidase family protein n=1 Tax=Promicromonospora panici TaxID=2219658 RepID=UPI00101D7079|nr:D-alanyl-D-alanine carboxypeptidase family protein [Promicromonospora panici]